MYSPRYKLGGFDVLLDPDKAAIILEMVESLVDINRRELRAFQRGAQIHGSDPVAPLYQSGAVYYPQGVEDDWKDVVQVLESGGGSCNSLTAWRVAELLESGEAAGPFVQSQIQRHKRGLVHVFHVILWRGSPQSPIWECPSRTLGMQAEPYD